MRGDEDDFAGFLSTLTKAYEPEPLGEGICPAGRSWLRRLAFRGRRNEFPNQRVRYRGKVGARDPPTSPDEKTN